MIDLNPEQRIARHKAFLGANWDVLAAFAWGHYLKDGRGMVVVPEEDVLGDDPRPANPRLSYAATGGALMSEVSAHFEAKEWNWLETYDPGRQVIIIVVRSDVGTSGYLIGRPPRPSEAYAGHKARRVDC